MKTGYVMNIQPFSVNDGDGIRTTVFLAGCPLRCPWCANPEGFSQKEIVGWHQRKCIGCGECERVCPRGIGIDLNAQRADCIACGACVSACPRGARVFMVQQKSADDVVAEIQKHRLFYASSGGGVTFSGGEATSQPDFFNKLTERIYDLGYSMDLETCGFFDFEALKPSLLRMDLIFMDLKSMDDEVHRRYTGVSNRPILENMARLSELPARKVIRIPVIGGVNDSEENIRASARFVHANLPEAKMELLPYHTFGKIKYEALGLPYMHPEFARPDKESMERLRSIIASEGVELEDFR